MKSRLIVWVLALLPVPVIILSLFLGRYGIPPGEVIAFLWGTLWPGAGDEWPREYQVVFYNIRIPRIVEALLVGAALGISGATLQGLFRNPLVSPYTLGLSSGAAFGAALATAFFPMLLGSKQVLAFAFGMAAVYMAYAMASRKGETPIVSLVLGGIVVGAFFSALVSIVQLMVDPYRLAGIVFWIMGGLHMSSWETVKYSAAPIMAGATLLIMMRWRLNVLSLGDEEARTLGLNVGRDRFLLIFAATMVAATAVSVSGSIGWVGLMVPHIVRMLVGPDHRLVIPLSATFGAAFLLLADNLARSVAAYEIPVGIITTLLGVPFFAYLMRKGGKSLWQ